MRPAGLKTGLGRTKANVRSDKKIWAGIGLQLMGEAEKGGRRKRCGGAGRGREGSP